MSILYPTALTRLVDNQWEVWKDQVVYELFSWHHDIWNPEDTPISVDRLLEKPTLEKLGKTTVSDICRRLAEEQLLERIDSGERAKVAGRWCEMTVCGNRGKAWEHYEKIKRNRFMQKAKPCRYTSQYTLPFHLRTAPSNPPLPNQLRWL